MDWFPVDGLGQLTPIPIGKFIATDSNFLCWIHINQRNSKNRDVTSVSKPPLWILLGVQIRGFLLFWLCGCTRPRFIHGCVPDSVLLLLYFQLFAYFLCRQNCFPLCLSGARQRLKSLLSFARGYYSPYLTSNIRWFSTCLYSSSCWLASIFKITFFRWERCRLYICFLLCWLINFKFLVFVELKHRRSYSGLSEKRGCSDGKQVWVWNFEGFWCF